MQPKMPHIDLSGKPIVYEWIHGNSENSYPLFSLPGIMGMMEVFFPGLAEFADEKLPAWPESSAPWSILSYDESGLLAQMGELLSEEGSVFIHPTATIGDFVEIEGPCYIGPGAEIRNSAYLRKGAWICSGALVGHSSEVKNSILLPDSKAPHFNYVGDSIIGIGANLGAGVKLSNVRNDRREILVTMDDGERVETGLRKMGAIIGDGCQLGCNAVTNPGALLMPGTMINPNVTVSGWNS